MSSKILECCACGAKIRERFHDPGAEAHSEATAPFCHSPEVTDLEGSEEWLRKNLGCCPKEARRMAMESSSPCPACGKLLDVSFSGPPMMPTVADFLGRELTRDDWYWELVSVRGERGAEMEAGE